MNASNETASPAQNDTLRITHPAAEMATMFFRNRAAVFGLVLLILIMVFTFIGPLIHTTDPFEMVWAPFSYPGQEGFLLGTDYLGRDILAAMMVGVTRLPQLACFAYYSA